MSIKQYTEILSPRATPQSEAIPGREEEMQPNAAGGYAFRVSPWTLLDRFLLLGSDRPTYYASARTLTKANVDGLRTCVTLDGMRAVARIVEVSQAGRAPKNDPAILALALAAKVGDLRTRRLALEMLPQVCRTGTHLFSFCAALQTFGGWGRATKRAVAAWYLGKDPQDLAYQLTKYAQRDGWTHRDVLRLAHVRPDAPHGALLRYAAKGQWESTPETEQAAAQYTEAVLELARLGDEPAISMEDAAYLIRAHHLPREVVPSGFLSDARIWRALLEDMPFTALMRNLATLTRLDILAPLSDATARVVERLGNAEALRKARVHPIAILMALKTYAAGRGMRGQHTWTPVPQITAALDDAFYKSYACVEPAGSKMLIALDVSGSMGWGTVGGVDNLSPREAAAALALVMANTEPQFHIMAFAEKFVPLDLSPGLRLDQATARTAALPFGRTDCAQPMIWALQHKVPVDTFVVVTDNETWHGAVHPVQALARYRQEMGRPAKLIVAALTATDCSIADPEDAGTLDVVGFDAAVPTLITDFVRG